MDKYLISPVKYNQLTTKVKTFHENAYRDNKNHKNGSLEVACKYLKENKDLRDNENNVLGRLVHISEKN